MAAREDGVYAGCGVKARREATGPPGPSVGNLPRRARFAGGFSLEETAVDRRKSVWAPDDTQRLLELVHTAIVVGTGIAAMWRLFDLFSWA